jgi:DNA-3-methyladenine glycosylase II
VLQHWQWDTRRRGIQLGFDPKEATQVLSKSDKKLGKLIERVGPFRRERRGKLDPFQNLIQSIIYQQLSGKAASTIHGRVLALFPGDPGLTPDRLLKLPDTRLREAGMSRAKIASVQDLARKTLEGVVPSASKLRRMEDEEIISCLTVVRGIGEWTVQMMLMFYLGRPDVMPAGDLGVRKGFQLTYGLDDLPEPAALKAHGEKWRPYRSVASWYMWRALELKD